MPHKVENIEVDTTIHHGDWRDDLFINGFTVVKGTIGPEKAQLYIDQMFSWLEKFPHGFNRKDRSTWSIEHLPDHQKGGMYHGYRVQHEKFVWDARTEPGVLQAFSKLWGTDELLVSFDGINLTLPTAQRTPTQPWPHIDQSPMRKGLVCAQGIINFAPNGPDDGGLVVMQGSHALTEKFFKLHPEVVGRKTWGPEDWFGFTEEEVAWFKQEGCKVVKVCAGPGDLIIWDSRTIHYNTLPTSGQTRAIIYACYAPAKWASDADLELKGQLFQERKGTTHWPNMNIYPGESSTLRLGIPDPYLRDEPFDQPEESEQILKLAGILNY